MGIKKLTALDTEKQEARKNYNTAKAEYEREYCGFPFERLHVGIKAQPSSLRSHPMRLLRRRSSSVWTSYASD